MLEYRLWYLEPSSYRDRGFVYSLVSVVARLVALLAVLVLLW